MGKLTGTGWIKWQFLSYWIFWLWLRKLPMCPWISSSKSSNLIMWIWIFKWKSGKFSYLCWAQIFSLPFWKNKMVELSCIPVSKEKGMVPRGSWPLEVQEMRTDEVRRKLEALCLTLEYAPFPVFWFGFFNFPQHWEVEQGDFCAASPAAFEALVPGVAMWVSTLRCLC